MTARRHTAPIRDLYPAPGKPAQRTCRVQRHAVTTPTYAGRVSRRYRSPARRQMRFLSWLCLVLAAACALSPVTHALGQPDSWPVCGPMAGLWLAMAVWTRWPSRERRP